MLQNKRPQDANKFHIPFTEHAAILNLPFWYIHQRRLRTTMVFYIRNMVCNRCIAAVRQEFEMAGLKPRSVILGEVEIEEEGVSVEKLAQLDAGLMGLGFERIDDRKARLIEAMKKKIIQLIHHAPQVDRKYNWSKILSEEMHYDYNHLSSLFSSVEGITIEHYIINQKIEKVKELLFYDELNLSEIADRLGYSSLAHLSSQFKKVTGFTPSEMKKRREIEKFRKPLDKVG